LCDADFAHEEGRAALDPWQKLSNREKGRAEQLADSGCVGPGATQVRAEQSKADSRT